MKKLNLSEGTEWQIIEGTPISEYRFRFQKKLNNDSDSDISKGSVGTRCFTVRFQSLVGTARRGFCLFPCCRSYGRYTCTVRWFYGERAFETYRYRIIRSYFYGRRCRTAKRTTAYRKDSNPADGAVYVNIVSAMIRRVYNIIMFLVLYSHDVCRRDTKKTSTDAVRQSISHENRHYTFMSVTTIRVIRPRNVSRLPRGGATTHGLIEISRAKQKKNKKKWSWVFTRENWISCEDNASDCLTYFSRADSAGIQKSHCRHRRKISPSSGWYCDLRVFVVKSRTCLHHAGITVSPFQTDREKTQTLWTRTYRKTRYQREFPGQRGNVRDKSIPP